MLSFPGLLAVCRGDLPESRTAAYEQRRREYEGLARAAGALGDALQQGLPPLPPLGSGAQERGEGAISLIIPKAHLLPAAEDLPAEKSQSTHELNPSTR